MARARKPGGTPSLGMGETQTLPVPFEPRCYDGGSGPNTFVAEWIRQHARPYDPQADSYRCEALIDIVQATKATVLYNVHRYWSKKPHDALMRYIEHFTDPGDVVLDPFSGSGSTALSALLLGRKAVAFDLSPAASFITKNYCCPVDPDAMRRAFTEVQRRIAPEMEWLYETRCHRCGGKATTGYTVYSELLECVRCNHQVPLCECVPHEGVTSTGKRKVLALCPHCGQQVSTRTNRRCGAIPVEVSVICQAGCQPARDSRRYNDEDPRKRSYFEKHDLGKIEEIAGKEIPHGYPTTPFPQGKETARLHRQGFSTVDLLFTRRNLWGLSTLKAAIDSLECSPSIRDWLLLAFSGTLLNVSNMLQHSEEWGGGLQAGTYYVPPIRRESPVSVGFEYKAADILRALPVLVEKPFSAALVSTQDSTDMSRLPDNSVDYIFTDPAYGDSMQFGELNFVWEAWLGFNTQWYDREIVVNKARGQDEKRWFRLMLSVMRECYRVLKPGRWLSLCYHDTSDGTWDLVQQLMEEAGFIPDSAEKAVAIDAIQKSYNQLMADQVLKRDLVINFRKPYPDERPIRVGFAFEPQDTPALFQEKVTGIIYAFLTKYPGATRDHIWDAVVSRLVRQGDMQRHDFDSILRQVAAANDAGEWFLVDAEVQQIGASEAAREDAAAAAVVKLIERSQEETSRLGVDYSRLFEWYVGEYRGDRPRRRLVEWLPDYFFPAPGGGWRNSATEEERAQKRLGRESGLNHRIRRYLREPTSITSAPDTATLCDWLRHCLRAGLYDEGRRLLDDGHIRLAEIPMEKQMEVEDDAAMCRLYLRQRVQEFIAQPEVRKRRVDVQGSLDL